MQNIPGLKQISETLFEIPKTYKDGMNVPARIYASKKLFEEMDEGVIEQVTNVACLPGIQKYSFCMPDGHWGYGFPIGGVGAFDLDKGIISPGGIGFDINCGMRLLATNLTLKDIQPRIHELVDQFFRDIPAGIGCKGFVSVNLDEFKKVLKNGTKWAAQKGFATPEDVERTEDNGCIEGADPSKVSDRAIKRGIDQIGTLGSGNHYLEIQAVKDENIFNKDIAAKFGIYGGDQIVIMFHCGSRGFGHQIGTDYLQTFSRVMPKYGLQIRDKELTAAPFASQEGQDYFVAMKCAANMAFANRQVIMYRIREVLMRMFKVHPDEIKLVYDVAHNIAKVEEYDGKKVLVHRKGATRSFGPGHHELPEVYKETGQPVIIGGSMETGSYLLVGTKLAEQETFGSTCHGAGRRMSRGQAKRTFRGDKLQREMDRRGIYVHTVSYAGLAEEAGGAYKNVSEVVDTVDKAGLSKKVARFVPIGNMKG